MKKIILSALLFVMLISMNYENSNATCPSGYINAIHVFGPDANGCSWSVNFCYTCGVTNLDTCNIKTESITPLGGCDLANLDQSWLVRQYRTFLINNCNPIKPCSEGCTFFKYDLPLCYKWHCIGFYDINNVYHYVVLAEYCNDGSYCEIIDGICIDNSTTPSSYQHCGGIAIKHSYNTNCQQYINKPTLPYEGWVGVSYSNCFQFFDCDKIAP